MSDDLYTRLGERLNQNDFKVPVTTATLNFLKELFTQEQARLGAEFPMGAHCLKKLAERLSRDEAALERLLEGMADEGLVFVAPNDQGEKEYSLSPYVPGLLEFQYLRGEDTDKVRRRTALITEVWKELEGALGLMFESIPPEKRNALVPTLRTLAVEEHLPGDTQIASWEKITEILDRETSFAAGACYCREKARHSGRPCKLENLPPEACIYFGKVADFMVARKFAKRFTREGVLNLLKDCEKAGLLHNLNNHDGENTVLCNCCGCCCDTIALMRKIQGFVTIRGSNFVATVDKERCIGCGQCIDHCQVGALTMQGDDTAAVMPGRCLGCGNCVDRCPVGCITLVRCADTAPPPRNPRLVGLGR